jgi:hypothetical protein
LVANRPDELPMDIQSHTFDRMRRFLGGGLDFIEYIGLLAIRFGHTRFPYREDANNDKPYARE